ncbi:CRISPR-associated protein Cas5 [Zhaonella formicivorans]|uniref:CRISPR-associated protein Cas5 n=1 Tax=Zhaonella formicivorans TaxID=2528593 RepID=UPI001D12F884|nr:CRISPR-associated protein Cas5 [Zhaonella formicivorans]
MEILAFHLKGKMAHFRRYYSNSSALSYTIPPRTTIIGILAGLLGYKRDSYYDLFSLQKCYIAVALCSPIKKTVQKLNLLMVKSPNDLNGSKEHHSQTATELIIPQDIVNGYLDYKVWFCHREPDIFEELKQLLTGTSYGYLSKGISLGLGIAQNLGWLEFENSFEGTEITTEGIYPIYSIIPAAKIKELVLDNSTELSLIKEELPLEFDLNRKLTPQGKGHMIINLNMNPINARITNCIQLNNGECIVWME